MTQTTACPVCNAQVEQPTRGRRRIYCSKPCSRKASRDRVEQRCAIDGCERPNAARGMCASHYGTWHRKKFGRKDLTYDHTCEICGSGWSSRSRVARFCSDVCKGQHYSATMRRKSKLPANHPVMVLIAEQRKPKPKPERIDQRSARQCPGCASWFCPLHHAAASQMVCCSQQCSKRMSRRRRRAREHGARGSWTWSEFLRIAKKFDYCCAYCGEKPERLDPDHVVPLSRGGSDSPSNLLPTCLMCNSSKCAMTLPEWSGWLAARGLPPRRTAWVMGDRRYTHLAYTDPAISPAA